MNFIKWLQLAAVVVVAVILFYGIWRGEHRGALRAQSETVLANARVITKGLDYFHADQNRYPSPEEFLDKNLMSAYIGSWPPPALSAGACQNQTPHMVGNFDYHSLDYKTYRLDFCLPASIEGFPAGPNSVGIQ